MLIPVSGSWQPMTSASTSCSSIQTVAERMIVKADSFADQQVMLDEEDGRKLLGVEPILVSISASACLSQVMRLQTTKLKATSRTSPRRNLDADLARAITEAKLATEKSWRKVAKATVLSHSYLVQVSNGQRVPSRKTVELLAEVLPMEGWAVERLRNLAG